MQSLLTSEMGLTISSDSVENYAQLAYRHLSDHDASIDVEEAGVDETGKPIFGICMRSEDGEEWYDPADQGDDIIAGWVDRDEAQVVLDTKVLPNLGYAIYQRDLQLFHQNMIHE